MSVIPGTRLGVYEVRDLIGSGGMGEVYRGHDTRLKRDVALKILPELFALDVDRLGRFKREAEVLASLNHANIASIFGFEESEGVHALVLELVDGPTLADCIAEGPIPLEDARPIARQIAEALEAAHAESIVHRDLKPANVKIRKGGTVKVLDFGLAKALTGDGSPTSPDRSLTITSPAVTQLGVILGTAAYMSPEQARGRTVDKRSDIWAFGGVLFEMLTGKRAFDGEDVSDTLANVLKREPDWSALPANTPGNIYRTLRRCLEKDPARRFHDIADVRLELEEQESVPPPVPSGPLPRGPTLERVAWGLLVALLGGGLAYTLTREPPARPVVRFQIDPPPGGSFGASTGVGRLDGTSGATLSPDGTQIAFIAELAGRTQLWLRRLDAFAPRALAGTDDAMVPFWSPDSREIAFFAGRNVKAINVADGTVRTICDVVGVPRGASWGSQGVIVFSSGLPARLARVDGRGGPAAPLERGDQALPFWPSFLPDGRRFLYQARFDRSDASSSVVLGSIEPGFQPKRIVASAGNGQMARPGVLLFARDDALFQQPFDLDREEVAGEATMVVDQIYTDPEGGRADFSASHTGVLAFRSASNRSNQFAWFDRSGKLLETVGPVGVYRIPDLSPDGTRLAYSDITKGDIMIYDLSRKFSSNFTTGTDREVASAWFPDGNKIAYRKQRGGMFVKDTSGTGTERQLLEEVINGPSQVSGDGKWVLYFKVQGGIYVLPTTGDPTPKVIVAAGVEPRFSPNTHWVAYASSETGQNEIYVQPFPPTGQRWPVSSSGGRQPLWRADGKELFFVNNDGRLFAVDVDDKAKTFEYGTPRFLFQLKASVYNTGRSYVPSRDGQRFLVNTVAGTDDAPIRVVQNWQAGVGR